VANSRPAQAIAAHRSGNSVVERKSLLRAKVVAANVMAIRSFAAPEKSSGAFARQKVHGASTGSAD
jgi:hypothetical protein